MNSAAYLIKQAAGTMRLGRVLGAALKPTASPQLESLANLLHQKQLAKTNLAGFSDAEPGHQIWNSIRDKYLAAGGRNPAADLSYSNIYSTQNNLQ